MKLEEYIFYCKIFIEHECSGLKVKKDRRYITANYWKKIKTTLSRVGYIEIKNKHSEKLKQSC